MANALAIATRCCCPPDSSDGRWREPVAEADGADDDVEPLGLGVGLVAGERERQRDVLPRGERRHQVERLEHEPHPLAAQRRELAVRQESELGVTEEHLTRRQRVEAGEAVHQRRLPGARRPHDGGEAAAGDLDGHVVECLHRLIAGAVHLGGGRGAGDRRAWRCDEQGWMSGSSVHGSIVRLRTVPPSSVTERLLALRRAT